MANHSSEHVFTAVKNAAATFRNRVLHPPSVRSGLLRHIAQELENVSAEIREAAGQETALPAGRLEGELARTTGQLRMFADVLDEGSWVGARLDPDVELRRMLVPIGPVAVFSASNFPLAFSVPGGDTASALAAGCPVIVKAHPAHPETSRIAAEAISTAVTNMGIDHGVFSMVEGGIAVGEALVAHPDLAAVAFTGSLGGGRAIFDLAAGRDVPIPVFAEMGSINPMFVLPGALADRPKQLAADLAASVTLGVGQFCTNPGLVITVDAESFATELARHIAGAEAGTMLSDQIGKQYASSVERMSKISGVEMLSGEASPGQPVCALTTADVFLAQPELAHEVFGPSTLVVSCANTDEMIELARSLEGQLTATVQGDPENPDDVAAAAQLFDILSDVAGRLIWNGYPTGVAVTDAMQHGGPYPASTASATTSVGTAAMERFLRPVAYQGVPAALLPEVLKSENPDGLMRRVGGRWTAEPAPS